jgi:hypothetical protein
MRYVDLLNNASKEVRLEMNLVKTKYTHMLLSSQQNADKNHDINLFSSSRPSKKL